MFGPDAELSKLKGERKMHRQNQVKMLDQLGLGRVYNNLVGSLHMVDECVKSLCGGALRSPNKFSIKGTNIQKGSIIFCKNNSSN